MNALESQPGIVLTRAERDGAKWRFVGLRDPLARNPAAVLAGVLGDTSGVEQRWEPYLSLQPAMVLARVRRSLSPPASVVLTLASDTLRLRGSASLPWVITAGRAPLPLGVAALDLSGVKSEIPPGLAQLVREIEA